MQWVIPGTTLTGQREEADTIEAQFQSLFLAGGLTLSQVSTITGIAPYTIQNWIKRKFLSPPQGKRYDMEQVCRLININILKGSMPLEEIIHLICYLHIDLTSESDIFVNDTDLFFFFTRLAACAKYLGGSKDWDDALLEITENYQEPVPGAKIKLMNVLKIMLTAWYANILRLQAENMIAQL